MSFVKWRTLAEIERSAISEVLRAYAWKKGVAAKALGIGRATLYRKIKRYKIAKEGDSHTNGS